MFMIGEFIYSMFSSLFSSKPSSIKIIIILIAVLLGGWFVYSTSSSVLTYLGFATKENLKKKVVVLKKNNITLSNINDVLVSEIDINDKANNITLKTVIKSKDQEHENEKVLDKIEVTRKDKITTVMKKEQIVETSKSSKIDVVKKDVIILNKEKFNTISKINISSIWKTYQLTIKKGD